MRRAFTVAALAALAGSATVAIAADAGRIVLFGQSYRVDRFDYAQEVTWIDSNIGEVNLIECEGIHALSDRQVLISSDAMDFFGVTKNVVVLVDVEIDADTGIPSGLKFNRLVVESNPDDRAGFDLSPSGVTVNPTNVGLGAGGNVVVSNSETEELDAYDFGTGAFLGGFSAAPSANSEDVTFASTGNGEFWIVWQDSPYQVVRQSLTGTFLGQFPIAGDAHAGLEGEPKGITFLDGAGSYPAFFGGQDIGVVALDDNGPGLQAFDVTGSEVAFEPLVNPDSGANRLDTGPCGSPIQLESLAADPTSGRLFLLNQGDVFQCNLMWVLTPVCASDWNGDGFVSGDDFDLYVTLFELGGLDADFNGDGFVTGDDFDAFGAAFEVGC